MARNTFTGPKTGSDATATTTTNIPNTETTTKYFNPAGQFKPGSGLTESTIPNDSVDLAGPLAPGAGNTRTEGITTQPNVNPEMPVGPENIPGKIEDKLAYLTVYSESNSNKPVEICVYTYSSNEVEGNPYCIETFIWHLSCSPGSRTNRNKSLR